MLSKYLKEENIHINHISLHSCRLRTGLFPLIAVISHEWCHLLDVFYHLVWERWRQKLEWNRLWTLSVWEPLAIKAYYNYYNSNNNNYYYLPVISKISGVVWLELHSVCAIHMWHRLKSFHCSSWIFTVTVRFCAYRVQATQFCFARIESR